MFGSLLPEIFLLELLPYLLVVITAVSVVFAVRTKRQNKALEWENKAIKEAVRERDLYSAGSGVMIAKRSNHGEVIIWDKERLAKTNLLLEKKVESLERQLQERTPRQLEEGRSDFQWRAPRTNELASGSRRRILQGSNN